MESSASLLAWYKTLPPEAMALLLGAHERGNVAILRRLRRVAYHETGHAYAAWMEDLAFRRVTIVPNLEENSLGHTLYHPSPPNFRPDVKLTDAGERRIRQMIVTILAGEATEDHYCGRDTHRGATPDRREASDLAQFVTGGERESDAFLTWLLVRTKDLVTTSSAAAAISALATALLEQRIIAAQEALAIMRKAILSMPRP